MKLKTSIFSLLLLISFTKISAQSYDIALGLRFGTDMGVTYKHRIAKRVTLEAIIQTSFQREEAIVTLLAERHFPILTKRLNIYAGLGPHRGWLTETGGEIIKDPIGLTAIVGAEFTIRKLNISYDIKPAFNFVGGEKRVYIQTGVSIRYVLKRKKLINWKRKKKSRNKKSINWRFWEKG